MCDLLVCTMCGTEKVAETIEYEPRPVWTTPGAAPTRGA
jgi:hypothetical protein